MRRYKISYKNKTAISRGATAEEAFEKYAARPVFGGNNRIPFYSLKMYDADTRGGEWAQYNCGTEADGTFLAMSETI